MPTIARRVIGSALSLTLYLASSSAVAWAHGGMAGPEELGPPVFTSVLIGIACYMLMITWPSPKQPQQDEAKAVRRKPMRRKPPGFSPPRELSVRLVRKVSNS